MPCVSILILMGNKMTDGIKPQTSVKPNKKTSKEIRLAESQMFASEDRFIFTEPMLHRMLEEAFEYFEKDPEALSIEGWLLKKRIWRQTWYEWVGKHDWFRKAHEHFLILIADRRDRGSITRKYDRESAYRSIHLYDPDKWKQIYDDTKKKHEDMNKPTTIVVEMKKVGADDNQ